MTAAVSPPSVSAAILCGHPVQHFAPGLRLLADRSDLTTRVYYWNAAADGLHDPGFGRHVRWRTELHDGYDWWSPTPGRPRWRRAVSLLAALRRLRPNVLLAFGWTSPTARLGIVYATATATPLLFYGDSSGLDPIASRHPRLRRRLLGYLFRTASGAVATGTFNRDFYLAHGMPERLVHPGVYPTDVEAFAAAAGERPPSTGDRPVVIGFAGKFLPIKAVDDLVEAAAGLPRDRPWELWLIGDGPLRPDIEALVTRCGIGDRTKFLGFRNTDELPSLMAAVDIMVMPSRREPRGLVAIEAMAAGAAVVVSSATGLWGAGDVVSHGDTGLVYPAGDVDALTAILRQLVEDADRRSRLTAAGKVRALSFGPRDFANTAATALLTAARRERDAHVAA